MGIRDSFSGLKEKMKLKLPGKKRKPDGTGTGTDGEGDEPAILLPQPVYVVADGGHDRGVGGPNTGGREARSAALVLRSDRPESIPNDQEGGTDVDGGEVGRKRSNLHPGGGIAVGSGPDQEGDGVDGETVGRISPSPSILPILPYSGKPNGT